MAWKKIGSKTLYKHSRITLVEDTVELPNGTQVPYLRFENASDSVCIICIKDSAILIQKEYSYPPNEVLYQFPGGKVELNETLQAAAIRELAEESGLLALKIEKLGWFYVDNRRSEARMHIFVVNEFSEVKKSGGDLEEDISNYWLPAEEVESMIKDGRIVNYSLLAAWSLLRANKEYLLD